MTRRAGLTTVEILVSIFMLAIGTLAVMSMFPLAAVTMGQSFKTDRTTTSANNADGFLRSYWYTRVVDQPNGGGEPFFDKLDPLQPTGTPGTGTTQARLVPPGEPSFPVAIDPMGWYARTGRLDQGRLGDTPVGTLTQIPRVSLRLIDEPLPGNPDLAQRLCSQPDGIGWADGGEANKPGQIPGQTTVERELR